MPDNDDDERRPSPPAVVGAVSLGTVPLPFLAVYAVLFILHGWISPAHPPDITSSQTGELIAGLIALAAFVALSFAILQFLNARRRWPWAIGEFAVAATCFWFLTDDTKGGATISLLLLVCTLVALGLGFAPSAWHHVRRTPPGPIVRLYALLPSAQTASDDGAAGDRRALPISTEPTLVEPASLRRRAAPRPSGGSD